MVACIIILSISAFFIFYAMVGYPVALLLLNKLFKRHGLEKDLSLEPQVSYMIVAHNEEKCIEAKLENILSFDYPMTKIQILIASDFCTDRTNDIVRSFMLAHPNINIVLNETKEHKGKTNAQNETQKLATGDVLIMTDANSIFDPRALRELVASFSDPDIWYVCGRLTYTNDTNSTGANESAYWRMDLKQREIESNFQTITAGNGSIYAIRNERYLDLKPIYCHDSQFPLLFALEGKKCKYNKDAIAYEKAGETNQDEFKRKVRMNRTILEVFISMWRPLNIFRYRWFSFFYFGHRTCRYLLWFNHLVFLITSVVFLSIGFYIPGGILVGGQLFLFILGIASMTFNVRPKLLRMVGYYALTVMAQSVAAFRQLLGKSKPVWEKAESTR